MHFNLFDLTSLQIFPTIPQPIVVAAAVFFALWVLVRWGSLLLLFYALTLACVGEWGPAVIAVLFAILIGLGNGFGSWLEWNAHGRDAALRRHDRDHARHESRLRTVSRHFPAFPVLSGRIATRKMTAKVDIDRAMEKTMSDVAFDDELLTDDEVVARYKGRITLGTLRNWRALKLGPPYVKVGRAVLYSRSALQAWDKRNTVNCSKLA